MRTLTCLAALLLLCFTPTHANEERAPEDGMTPEEEARLPVESVRWAESAVAKAKIEEGKITEKIGSAKTAAQRDALRKQAEAYHLAAVYYQSYVDYMAAQDEARTRILAVNTALQERKPADELRARVVAQNEVLEGKLAEMEAAQDDYRRVAGDRLMEPTVAVAELYARRKAARDKEE